MSESITVTKFQLFLTSNTRLGVYLLQLFLCQFFLLVGGHYAPLPNKFLLMYFHLKF